MFGGSRKRLAFWRFEKFRSFDWMIRLTDCPYVFRSLRISIWPEDYLIKAPSFLAKVLSSLKILESDLNKRGCKSSDQWLNRCKWWKCVLIVDQIRWLNQRHGVEKTWPWVILAFTLFKHLWNISHLINSYLVAALIVIQNSQPIAKLILLFLLLYTYPPSFLRLAASTQVTPWSKWGAR